MNVYDFDKTIFNGDSTFRFILFELRRHPRALCYLPRIGIAAFIYYALHMGTKTQFKEKMYSLLKVCDTERDAEAFWKRHISGIKPFYRRQHDDSDVIISASPEFLLKPLEEKLRVTVIASRVSPADGKTTGLNCYHQEKVVRFRQQYGEIRIDSFYSDSYSDEPLALIAEKAFIVDGDRILPWNYDHHKKRLRT